MNILEIIGKAAVPAIVLFCLWFFRARFSNDSIHLSESEIEKLNERFRNLKWLVLIAMIVVAVAFFFGMHALLAGLNQYIARSTNPSTIELYPQSAIWWFFPGFGALSLCWEITIQLWAFFGDRSLANSYADWSSVAATAWGGPSGMDTRKVLRILALVVALPIGIFTILALPMHASVGPSTIIDCGYAFKPCKTFPLADA